MTQYRLILDITRHSIEQYKTRLSLVNISIPQLRQGLDTYAWRLSAFFFRCLHLFEQYTASLLRAINSTEHTAHIILVSISAKSCRGL